MEIPANPCRNCKHSMSDVYRRIQWNCKHLNVRRLWSTIRLQIMSGGSSLKVAYNTVASSLHFIECAISKLKTSVYMCFFYWFLHPQTRLRYRLLSYCSNSRCRHGSKLFMNTYLGLLTEREGTIVSW